MSADLCLDYTFSVSDICDRTSTTTAQMNSHHHIFHTYCSPKPLTPVKSPCGAVGTFPYSCTALQLWMHRHNTGLKINEITAVLHRNTGKRDDFEGNEPAPRRFSCCKWQRRPPDNLIITWGSERALRKQYLTAGGACLSKTSCSGAAYYATHWAIIC